MKSLDFLINKRNCTNLPSCRKKRKYLVDRMSTAFNSTREMAILNLARYNDFLKYHEAVKKKYKGAAVRHAKKALKQGFTCHEFERGNFIPDIRRINVSKKVRAGGKMRESYLSTVKQMGGVPKKFKEIQISCPVHCDHWWGVFENKPGHQQGINGIITNERLLGYIKVAKYGNFALYGKILGHGDYLKYGIMYLLHFKVMNWILDSFPEDENTRNLKYLVYAGFKEVGGLLQWKKKMLFEPDLIREVK